MWWRARWKFRKLRAAIAAAGQHRRVTPSAELGVRPSASGAAHPPVHRDTLRTLAEREGVHPLFLYPELRFRTRDRDNETDKARLATIRQSVRSAISNAENELLGLQARLEHARQSAATFLATTGSRNDQELDENEPASVEVRLLAPEKRIEGLKHHLIALRRIESAVNKELNS
jgi:hypothetical protein